MHLDIIGKNVIPIPLKRVVMIIKRISEYKPIFRILEAMKLVKE
jgi:hypothetical protein